jgi:hypothetical protein
MGLGSAHGIELDQHKITGFHLHIQVRAKIPRDDTIDPGLKRAKFAGVGAMFRLGTRFLESAPVSRPDLNFLARGTAPDAYGN